MHLSTQLLAALQQLHRAVQPVPGLGQAVRQHLLLNLRLWSRAPADSQAQLFSLLKHLAEVQCCCMCFSIVTHGCLTFSTKGACCAIPACLVAVRSSPSVAFCIYISGRVTMRATWQIKRVSRLLTKHYEKMALRHAREPASAGLQGDAGGLLQGDPSALLAILRVPTLLDAMRSNYLTAEAASIAPSMVGPAEVQELRRQLMGFVGTVLAVQTSPGLLPELTLDGEDIEV